MGIFSHKWKLNATITGASSGIGEGIAIKFAQLGCRLTITGRSVENLQRVNDLCKKAGVNQDQVNNQHLNSENSKELDWF